MLSRKKRRLTEEKKRGRGGEWPLGEVLQETILTESPLSHLQTKNLQNTYKWMSDMPPQQIGGKIVRGNSLPFLSELFYEEDYEALKTAFKTNPRETMTKENLKEWMQDRFGENNKIMEDFDRIFNLMDLDLDGLISWTELVSQLEAEMVERHTLVNGFVPPFIGDYIQGPTRSVVNPRKRLIADVVFWPSVTKERRVEAGVGKYVMVTDRGEVDFYNLDLQPTRGVLAPSPWPRGYKTVVKSVCVLPEIDVLCLGCIGRDLCFYDCRLGKMELVYHITNLDSHPICMVYKFYEDPARKSYIAIGGVDGSVVALLFRTNSGGPFKKPYDQPFIVNSFQNIRMGGVEGLEARLFGGLHSGWIESLRHLDPLDCLLSTSNSRPVSLALLDVDERCVLVSIDIPLGVTCADLLTPPPNLSSLPLTGYEKEAGRGDKRRLLGDWWLVTGGLDTRLRIWDLADTRQPRVTLSGHISVIKFLIVEHDPATGCPLILSYGRIGRINVWNARTFESLQLYTSGLEDLPEDTPLSHCYNSHFKTLLLCTYKILLIKVGRFVDPCVTSGHTESHEILSVLYNHHYDFLVTVTLGSVITRWNPETGQRELVLPGCHSTPRDGLAGETLAGITAAAFNPAGNLLATGASDGSLRLWDVYKGAPFRTFLLPGAIRYVFWLKFGLLGITNTGEGRLFPSRPPPEASYSCLHLPPSLSAVLFMPPSVLLIGTITGQIIFADFATGQPLWTKTVSPHRDIDHMNSVFEGAHFIKYRAIGKVCVEGMFLLESRPDRPEVGRLVVSLKTGSLQLWSTHPEGGCLGAFRAVHHLQDCIVSFASDKKNKYLFTGSVMGYLKTWWLAGTCLGPGGPPSSETLPGDQDVEFPFLSDEFQHCPAREAWARDPAAPPLLASIRAHGGAIGNIIYFDESAIILSSGMKSVRYWTLTGQFLNSLGSTTPWLHTNLSGTGPTPAELHQPKIPTDLKRLVSSTTLKILRKDYTLKKKPNKKDRKREEEGEGDGRGEGNEEAEEGDKRSVGGEEGQRPGGEAGGGGDIFIGSAEVPFKRADLRSLMTRLETVQDGITRVPPLPDLAQEQLYQNIPFMKTEKVVWIKPPKIIRSKRKRVELTLLNRDQNVCTECKKDKAQTSRKLPHNLGISLEEGLKLREEERDKEEEKQLCRKCYWKTQNKKYKPRLDSLYDTELLGDNKVGMVENFGSLAKAAAAQKFGKAFLFGREIPEGKGELENFIKESMKLKGIYYSPKNITLIKNLIQMQKKNAILEDIKNMNENNELDMIKFDCFTKKEKWDILKKVKESQEELKNESFPKSSGNLVSGIYYILANCLYEPKYREMSDDELLKILTDLSKRFSHDQSESAFVAGYKKRFEWWESVKSKVKISALPRLNIPPTSGQIRDFVQALASDKELSETFQGSYFFEGVSGALMEAVKGAVCPGCGGRLAGHLPSHRLSHPLTLSDEEREEFVKFSGTRKKFNSLLKGCLVKASVGEIREEDALNELGKFLNKILVKCIPYCEKCRNQNFLNPKYDHGPRMQRDILEMTDRVIAFCKPRDIPYQTNLQADYQRSVLHYKRQKARDNMEKEGLFQREKEINIAKLEKRIEKLKKKMAEVSGTSSEAKKLYTQMRQELKGVLTKIREEYARDS